MFNHPLIDNRPESALPAHCRSLYQHVLNDCGHWLANLAADGFSARDLRDVVTESVEFDDECRWARAWDQLPGDWQTGLIVDVLEEMTHQPS